jgi:hypothetical protein
MAERMILLNNDQYPRYRYMARDTLERLQRFLPYLYERYVYEQPSRHYRRRLARVLNKTHFTEHGEQLCKDGVIILPEYFTGATLKEMQDDFDRWCISKTQLDQNGFVDFDGSKGESYLKTSIAFSRAAVDPYLTALASYYWGKPIKLAYSHGYRLEPVEEREYRAFRWHHDLKRKQIKVMILLSDVPSDGQRMDYIPGSHKVWHIFTNQRDVRFTKEEALRFGEPIRCTGPAGTVVVFDANGLHRGNRNLGPRRDQYTFNYTAGRALFPLPGLHPEVAQLLKGREKRLARVEGEDRTFGRSLRALKLWFVDRYFWGEDQQVGDDGLFN